MRHLPTDFLRSFVLIAETGNFTKAGEQLGRSQSAVSLQIKKLEQIAKQPLFSRQGHQFSLTPQGQILLSYARQILSLNDQALDELNPNALSGNIRLGIPSEFATSVLPKVVGEFSRNHPQVSLEVSCDLSRNLRKSFALNHYDVIFALTLINRSMHSVDNASQQNVIRQDELVWVGANRFQWQAEQEVQLIVAPEGCIYRQQALEWLTTAGIPWRIVYTIVEISGIQAALQAGIGITVLAKSAKPDDLSIIPTHHQQPSLGKIGMQLLKQEQQIQPATNKLIDYIERALKSND